MRRLIICLITALSVFALNAQNADIGDRACGYRGIVELGVGAAYNVNTAQVISTLNMQPLWAIFTSHGVKYKGLFGGVGFGYNLSQRDKENMYLAFSDVRYSFEKCKLAPSIGVKGGIIYDAHWIEKVKPYGAIGVNVDVYNGLSVGVEGSIFSRPARHFTANVFFVVSYSFGK